MLKLICKIILLIMAGQCAIAQAYNEDYLKALRWRMIGPHRGGRTVGAVGVPQMPNVFYIGVNNGGVWKTNDYGRTWKPIFDEQPTGSIGDIAVAPSDPNTIYVGTGEGLQRPDLSVGDGMYKSTDGGMSWSHIGLNAVQQIGGLAIDEKNSNRLFVAALGKPYGPNPERGVYRTLDGGTTWDQVLCIDDNTGAVQVTIDPNDPQIVFADLWAARLAPWENGMWSGANSGLYKSTDGGSNWRKITKGLPTPEQGLGRIGFCIAPSDSKRMYATVDAGKEGGIYRSDDAGESWERVADDQRYWSRGSDFAELKVDPRDNDIVYDANVVTWKSVDGGLNWNAFRGAPGGDDYHRIWINPLHPEIMLIASDQGAIITVNGGETFSSWYNQPTAQFYHVSTDNAFPYNVYGGQQESGSVCISSRSNDGAITYREWHPVGVEEYGYVAADPLNPDIIYGGKITRFDKRTGQVQNISPEAVRSGKYRFIRTAPVLFSPIDHRTLYFAGNVLFKTRDEGRNWQIISPDLTRSSYDDIPKGVGIYYKDEMKSMNRRGVIYTVAPSPLDIKTIWCGTDDGLIHVTRDGGKTWQNVTPPGLSSWSKISLIDAGRFDANTAFAAVNRIRCDDLKPHIYRTHDGGKTWDEIVTGLPDDPVNAVREDPVCRGLLYAGSERQVSVSFNDGAQWQSLRLNMPCTSIRDLVIKDDDVVVGTHGRSFWILDNITLLRQLNDSLSANSVSLFKPQDTWRVRWNMYPDTPLPQEEPGGENPPDGAMVDYFLASDAEDIRLEIWDAANRLIRTYSNRDTLYAIPKNNVPAYWIRPQQALSAKRGAHRFLWDLHYPPLNEKPEYPISATYMNTAPKPNSPWALPGNYTVKLHVDGKEYSQPLKVKMDPRVQTSSADLIRQHDLSLECYKYKKQCLNAITHLDSIRHILGERKKAAKPKEIRSISNLESDIVALVEESKEPGGFTMRQLADTYGSIHQRLQDSDRPPATAVIKGVEQCKQLFLQLMQSYMDLINNMGD